MPEAVEKVRQPPEGHQTHHPRDARGMRFGFPQYPFPAKKQPILRTAHTKSAVFSVKVSGFPVHARESRRYFHCPIFSKRFIDKLRHRKCDASLHVDKMQLAFCRGTFRTPPLRISFEASQMRCLLLFFGYCAVSGAGVSALMGPTRSARRSTQRSTPMAPLLRVSV